ncbi:hypothetical protein C8F01DRAFT_1098414 [Mycena amicta]|nr:hypothetical protein C8F01DRAFT_1098414 [Mycena amicta]
MPSRMATTQCLPIARLTRPGAVLEPPMPVSVPTGGDAKRPNKKRPRDLRKQVLLKRFYSDLQKQGYPVPPPPGHRSWGTSKTIVLPRLSVRVQSNDSEYEDTLTEPRERRRCSGVAPTKRQCTSRATTPAPEPPTLPGFSEVHAKLIIQTRMPQTPRPSVTPVRCLVRRTAPPATTLPNCGTVSVMQGFNLAERVPRAIRHVLGWEADSEV